MDSKLVVVVVGLAAALAGLIGYWYGQEQVDPVELRGRDASARDVGETELGGGEKSAADPRRYERLKDSDVEAERREPEGEPVGLFSPELVEHFHQGFLEGWAELRQDQPVAEVIAQGREQFESDVLSLPASIGRALATLKLRQEATQQAIFDADPVVLLEALKSGDWAPDPTTFDLDLLDRVMERKVSGADVNGSAFGDQEFKVADGMTVYFPAGIHRLKVDRLMNHRREWPKDLTIRGAGKDLTLLTLGEIYSRGMIERLKFENLTIDLGDDHFFDLRSQPLSLDLFNVRVIRFDNGAGGSLCFGVNKGAVIRATNSDFVGGYGRSPGSGDLYRGNPGWMYFKSCRFSLIDLVGTRISAIRFDGCRFELFKEDPTLKEPHLFINSVVEEVVGGGHPRHFQRLKISTLFPGFED